MILAWRQALYMSFYISTLGGLQISFWRCLARNTARMRRGAHSHWEWRYVQRRLDSNNTKNLVKYENYFNLGIQ
ncbi:hypothetical protein GGR55DRAFT_427780 [Xylaria sp. FL0064]|nr:hypothetical protein GGR55DRAFT_427780 [Xylaria sp. FL0064]